MVLGVVRAVWGEPNTADQMPTIWDTEVKANETDRIYGILQYMKELDVADATVETEEGLLLGILCPDGSYFAFSPN